MGDFSCCLSNNIHGDYVLSWVGHCSLPINKSRSPYFEPLEIKNAGFTYPVNPASFLPYFFNFPICQRKQHGWNCTNNHTDEGVARLNLVQIAAQHCKDSRTPTEGER